MYGDIRETTCPQIAVGANAEVRAVDVPVTVYQFVTILPGLQEVFR